MFIIYLFIFKGRGAFRLCAYLFYIILLQLRLPEGSSFDVMLSATVTAGHFFLQQPTHPTFHSLVGLTFQMSEMYNRDLTAPPLPHMEKGKIVFALYIFKNINMYCYAIY